MATASRQTAAYGIGRVIVAGSWFRSLKTAVVLMTCGLHCNILVKTARKGFARELWNKTNLSSGEWVDYSLDVKDVEVQHSGNIINSKFTITPPKLYVITPHKKRYCKQQTT